MGLGAEVRGDALLRCEFRLEGGHLPLERRDAGLLVGVVGLPSSAAGRSFVLERQATLRASTSSRVSLSALVSVLSMPSRRPTTAETISTKTTTPTPYATAQTTATSIIGTGDDSRSEGLAGTGFRWSDCQGTRTGDLRGMSPPRWRCATPGCVHPTHGRSAPRARRHYTSERMLGNRTSPSCTNGSL